MDSIRLPKNKQEWMQLANNFPKLYEDIKMYMNDDLPIRYNYFDHDLTPGSDFHRYDINQRVIYLTHKVASLVSIVELNQKKILNLENIIELQQKEKNEYYKKKATELEIKLNEIDKSNRDNETMEQRKQMEQLFEFIKKIDAKTVEINVLKERLIELERSRSR